METIGTPALWIGFIVFVLAMLALDLGVLHRKAERPGVRESLVWTAIWIVLAMLFAVGMAIFDDPQDALEFVTGYVIEKSLSVDNLFVFLVVFQYFAVPEGQQHRLLFWGIIGALVLRAIFIIAGAYLLSVFHPIIYVFGLILIITAIRLVVSDEESIEPDKNPLVRAVRRFFPVTDGYRGGSFFVRENGLLCVTPLFLALVVIEGTDVVFALDSIPAIFAVTEDPFIVFTSNIFAILGLRSLYFALAHALERLHYLKYGLALVLGFVGIKMLLSEVFKVPILVSLAVILTFLGGALAASLIWPPATEPEG